MYTAGGVHSRYYSNKTILKKLIKQNNNLNSRFNSLFLLNLKQGRKISEILKSEASFVPVKSVILITLLTCNTKCKEKVDKRFFKINYVNTSGQQTVVCGKWY